MPNFEPSKHLITREQIAALPREKIRVMVSACLAGQNTTWNAEPLGTLPPIAHFLSLPQVEAVTFCPEEFSFGTPRAMSNCFGGNGFDVLDGKAKVLTDEGEDWTEGMIRAAHEMAKRCRDADVHLALMLNISGACGTQTIYEGKRDEGNYQIGPGVAAAAVVRAGIPVLSNRDMKTLFAIIHHYDPAYETPDGQIDLHEHPWYLETFG